jgi:hypothetical protein
LKPSKKCQNGQLPKIIENCLNIMTCAVDSSCTTTSSTSTPRAVGSNLQHSLECLDALLASVRNRKFRTRNESGLHFGIPQYPLQYTPPSRSATTETLNADIRSIKKSPRMAGEPTSKPRRWFNRKNASVCLNHAQLRQKKSMTDRSRPNVQ